MFFKKVSYGLLACTCLFCCDDIIEEEDLSDRNVIILAPLNGSVINGNDVTFNWNSVEDARGYKVEVSSPDFDNAVQIVVDTLIVQDTLGNLRTRLSTILLNGAYQWRVKGLNSGFETPFVTSSFTVNGDDTVDLIPPNTPVLSAPANETVQDDTNIRFTWSREDIPGSTELDSIYIYTDEALQTLERKALGSNKSFETVLPSNTYYWTVRSFDGAGNASTNSAAFVLTINGGM